MKRRYLMPLVLAGLLLTGCGQDLPPETPKTTAATVSATAPTEPEVTPFLMGADVSSLLAQEASGVVYYDRGGTQKDLITILARAGATHIRVRVWHDPYDKDGNGYGGGNCDLSTAVTLGQRAKEQGMGLMLDLHYSDFWADPGKQQVPKAWQGLTLEEKEQAVYDYTTQCLKTLADAGTAPALVQIGNETTGGFCGETTPEGQYRLMAVAARAVRAADPQTQIVVHFTDPQQNDYGWFAGMLQDYSVDYDIFATSYYPCWHGTLEDLRAQLQKVIDLTGKQVMIAETAWAHTTQDSDGHPNSFTQPQDQPWPVSPQGQAQALTDIKALIAGLGDKGAGVCYWEPGWIAVPGATWQDRSLLWQTHGSGWASSYSAEYDPDDAGRWYGGSACDDQALFDSAGHALPALEVFGTT